MAKKTFSDRVRALAVLRLSHAQIAERLGTHPSYVKRILARRAVMGRPVAQRTLDAARDLLRKHSA